LCWREFYADVLWHRPDTAHQAFLPEMRAMEVATGRGTDERFRAWAEGRTGYPIVDAAMRQLVAEGWMHNRARMIVASFLVKDLHLDWTRGARWFMDHLVDGDLASNQHGWQWVAGTGTDAAPYVRVFNPTSQGERYDPAGDYVRRYVPELRDVAGKAIHRPWDLPGGPPPGYPPRIVDHAEEREEALRRFEAVRSLAT
jgi:deoxyribodipyrimidine photo-lyase